MNLRIFRQLSQIVMVTMVMLLPGSLVFAYQATHIFSVDDVIGSHMDYMTEPLTVADDPTILSPSPLLVDEDGTLMYGLDTDFFSQNGIDHFGILPSSRDGLYNEGFAGNVLDNGVQVGLKVKNAPDIYIKARPPLGTWWRTPNGDFVKGSSQSYMVMENKFTCLLTYPYDDAELSHDKSANALAAVGLSCQELTSPNNLVSLGGAPGELEYLDTNEWRVYDDILIDPDNQYSVSKDNDGTLIYRWGSFAKGNNDIRLIVRLPLPEEWATGDYPVTSAKLALEHTIAETADDQIKAEYIRLGDRGTGRLPSYEINASGYYKMSHDECYMADGTRLVGEYNAFLKYPTGADPTVPSEDWQEGYTAVWYTILDRDPFESDPVSGSGPEWALKANKFADDRWGLEIPKVDCVAPSDEAYTAKYVAGGKTTTIINLLDWKDGVSPLSDSSEWRRSIYYPYDNYPDFNLTEEFDMVIHIKNESKLVTLYSATLYINEEPPVPVDYAAAIELFKVPRKVTSFAQKRVTLQVSNTGDNTIASGNVVISNDVSGVVYSSEYSGFDPGELMAFSFKWTAPDVSGVDQINWTAKVYAEGTQVAEEQAISLTE